MGYCFLRNLVCPLIDYEQLLCKVQSNSFRLVTRDVRRRTGLQVVLVKDQNERCLAPFACRLIADEVNEKCIVTSMI